MDGFSGTSPWRAHHQWLWSHASPVQYSPAAQVPYLRYSICNHDLSNLDSLSDGDQSSSQSLHYNCNWLAPCGHLDIVFMMLRLWGKQSLSPPSRVCIITCTLLPRNIVFVWACMIFDEKVSISSFFIVLTVWFAAVLLPMDSSAQWHTNKWDILNLCKETNNSSISLSLIMFMIQLMVSVPRMTGTQDLKSVQSGMTRATWSSS